MTEVTFRRLTVAETAALHAFGEIDCDLRKNKARHSAAEAKGFFGQDLSGGEFLPESLTRLDLEANGHVFASIPMDPSWTVDRIWTACHAGARYAIYATLQDAPRRDDAWARLVGLGFDVGCKPTLREGAIGSPLAWDMTFFDVEDGTGRITAGLALL